MIRGELPPTDDARAPFFSIRSGARAGMRSRKSSKLVKGKGRPDPHRFYGAVPFAVRRRPPEAFYEFIFLAEG